MFVDNINIESPDERHSLQCAHGAFDPPHIHIFIIAGPQNDPDPDICDVGRCELIGIFVVSVRCCCKMLQPNNIYIHTRHNRLGILLLDTIHSCITKNRIRLRDDMLIMISTQSH